jgi:hypothetical protein
VTAAEARRAVNEAALARDRTALIAVAATLPVTQAFAYERRRARAYAHALDGNADFALAELSLAAAAEPPSAATLAADSAQLHLLLGDPARAVLSLEGAARIEQALDPHAGAVLVAAIREAPAAWFRGARAAFRSGGLRTTAATLGAAFDTVADRTVFRAGVAGAALAAAVVSFFTLPNHFFEGTSAAPRAGVTAPRAAVPPEEVVVAQLPDAEAPAPPGPDRATPDRTSPAEAGGGSATLVGFETSEPAASADEQLPPPGRPRASRPAPAPTPPSAPAPEPTPAPTPAPAPAPTPAPAPPAVDLPVAAAPAPATAPAPAEPKKPKAKAKGKEHAPGRQKKHEVPAAPAPPPPAPAAAEPPPSAAAPEREPEKPERAEKEHGREKDKESERGKKSDD